MVVDIPLAEAAEPKILAASSTPSVASSLNDSLVVALEGLECKSAVGHDEIP